MNILLRLFLLAVGSLVGSFANAQEIEVSDGSRAATFAVQLISEDGNESISSVDTDDTRRVTVPDEWFAEKAIIRPTLVITWKPTEQDKPAPNVTEMEVSLPLILRAWKRDNMDLNLNYFVGSNERAVKSYEEMRNPTRQKERLLGSLLTRLYFSKVPSLNPRMNRAKRVTEKAAEAARILTGEKNDKYAILPPEILHDFVIASFEDDPERTSDLLQTIELANGRVLQEVRQIELNQAFSTLNCQQKRQFFSVIREIAEINSAAKKLYFGSSDGFLDGKEELVLKRGSCR